jgi:hypothetical protein
MTPHPKTLNKKPTRKIHPPVCLASALLGLLLLNPTAHGQQHSYTIVNKEKIGTVSVENNTLIYTSPSGKKITASEEAFVTPTLDWRPSGPITCSWSPDNQYLAIITPHPRTSVINLINLKTQELLRETFPTNPPYPPWYQNVRATQDRPVKWDGNTLLLQTSVILPQKTIKEMPQILRITGKTFSVSPLAKNTPNHPQQKAQNPVQPTEKKHSIEW